MLLNDRDPGGNLLRITGFSVDTDGSGTPTSFDPGDTATITGMGSLTLHPDGSYEFIPDTGWHGKVPTIRYTISNGQGGTADAELDLTINAGPEAQDDEVSTLEDTPISGNVLTGTTDGTLIQSGPDSDPDSDTLTVTEFTIDINGDGTPETFTADGTPVTIQDAGGQDIGDLIVNQDGSYTFNPAQDWNGSVPEITYTISDGKGGEDTATLQIDVTPVNDPPVADGTIPDQDNEDAETVTYLDITSYFDDPDLNDTPSDTLTYTATGLPDGLTLDPNTGVISGTVDPSASQGGSDGNHTVTITATDGIGETATQTFTWTVTNPEPTANDDSATTDEDTDVSGNVLGGTGAGPNDQADTDPDGDTLTVTTFTVAGDPTEHPAGATSVTITEGGVTAGTITLDTDGRYTFSPAPDWNGTVPTITYTISDDEGGSDTADLYIEVTAVNDAPVIAEPHQTGAVTEAGHEDDGITIVPGTPSATGTFSATDVENDPLTWSVTGTQDTDYGTFSINETTGEWTYELDNDLPATQALKKGETKKLTYTVQVSDGQGGTDTRTVTITIKGTNDAPVANADTGAVTEAGVVDNGTDGNSPVTGNPTATGNVLANDTDVDAGEQLTLVVSDVGFGGTTGTLGAALEGTYGSLVLHENGTYTYTLDNTRPATQALKQGAAPTEVFTYTTVDVNGAISNSTLTITVNGTNDQPVITSAATAAQGEVTEQGTANPTEGSTATGTLTASDVDTDATWTWSIEDTVGTDGTYTTNGTYGTIAINPDTGEWTYTLDNTRAATQNLNDGDTPTETFTARVTDEFGAYREQTITITVNGSNDDLVGTGDATVTVPEDYRDSEDKPAYKGTLQDYVSDVDDVLIVTQFTVDADGDGTDETYTLGDTGNYTSGDPITLTDESGNTRGTLTIEKDGNYTFTPAGNYGGNVPPVTYTMTEDKPGGQSTTQKITFEITKISDAPGLDPDKTVHTNEDTAVALGLEIPAITDTGAGTTNDDHSERLGGILLTIGGAGADGVTLVTGAKTLIPVDGKLIIILTDDPNYHFAGTAGEDPSRGIYHLTQDEYKALQADPAPESGKNFTVTVSVTSYEVDENGAVIPEVAGATSTQVITVDVQAVTDGAALTINGGTSHDLEVAEEATTIDLNTLLAATLHDTDGNSGADTDGSETYWYTVSDLPEGSVVTIDGVATTISTGTPTATSPTSTSATPPSITITPPKDYSGDLTGIKITLHAKDTDTDSSGTPTTETSEVTLNLYVTPVAGDVEAEGVTTPEDTPVAFLKNVTVTDGSDGSEVIDSVSFEIPTGWTPGLPHRRSEHRWMDRQQHGFHLHHRVQ